jgi:hypothetical protein
MAPQYSQPTRLSDYIAFMLPWAHGHQLKAIGDFVAAIIEQQTACQAQLARYFGKQEAAVKRLSRLLHNERLDPRLLADAVLLQALHQLPQHGKVRLAIDWTMEADQHWLNGDQGYLMRRPRISIRLNSGEYGLRYLMLNLCGFQAGRRSSNASRVWIDALSMPTTVFCVIV